jgi:hypothetical protein
MLSWAATEADIVSYLRVRHARTGRRPPPRGRRHHGRHLLQLFSHLVETFGPALELLKF